MPSQQSPWSNEPSGVMRAALLTPSSSKPPAECFRTVRDQPKPTLPGPDWLLVKVFATGLNRAELRARAGEANIPPEWGMWASYWTPESKIPDIVGEEFVGIVEDVGEHAAAGTPSESEPQSASRKWKKGDRIAACYYGGGKAFNGAYAEYTIVHRDVARPLPGPDDLTIVSNSTPGAGEVSWTDLGAVPGSAWTAWGSLFQSSSVQAGQTVLVHGATSSVGIWAVLLAKHKGLKVIATTRQESKVAKLKDAGADHVLVEKGPGNDPEVYAQMADEILKIAPRGVNTFLELVNPNSLTSLAFKCTAFYGFIVNTGVLSKIWTMKDFSPLMIPGTRKLTMHSGTDCIDQFEECLRVVSLGIRDGIFKRDVFRDSVFDLDDIAKAHERAEANEATGKVVIDIVGATAA